MPAAWTCVQICNLLYMFELELLLACLNFAVCNKRHTTCCLSLPLLSAPERPQHTGICGLSADGSNLCLQQANSAQLLRPRNSWLEFEGTRCESCPGSLFSSLSVSVVFPGLSRQIPSRSSARLTELTTHHWLFSFSRHLGNYSFGHDQNSCYGVPGFWKCSAGEVLISLPWGW